METSFKNNLSFKMDLYSMFWDSGKLHIFKISKFCIYN